MDLTRLLDSASEGDPASRAKLIEAAYEDLRRLAELEMRTERPDHTLTATALVHEVSIELLRRGGVPLEGRAAFLAYVARAMRNLLVDHARTRGRQKRGGGRRRLRFEDALTASREQCDDFLDLHRALEDFADLDPRKAQVVELRYFGGLSTDEAADVLGVSSATVKRDWEVAKAWLERRLSDSRGTG